MLEITFGVLSGLSFSAVVLLAGACIVGSIVAALRAVSGTRNFARQLGKGWPNITTRRTACPALNRSSDTRKLIDSTA
jgi:hypothetical protein